MGLLTSAKPLAPSPEAKKGSKTKHQVPVKDLELYAQLDAVEKAACSMKETLGAEINGEAIVEFIALGRNGVRPDSFVGVEGNATASMELRKRSTASVPTDAERNELSKLGVKLETVAIKEELFGINPKYAQNFDLLGKVETALSGVVPEDFFFKQEKVEKQVVNETSVAEVFKLIGKDADKGMTVDELAAKFEAVLKMVTCQAIKPRLASTDMAVVLNAVKPHLCDGVTDAERATAALAK